MTEALDQLRQKKRELNRMVREAERLAGGNPRANAAREHSDLVSRISRESHAAAADIGAIPGVVNPERRQRCERDLLAFLTTYFPQSTGLKPFSSDHLKVIHRIQLSVLDGGRFVQAVYRAFGKTTIAELAAIWATIYGHRRFVPIFGADATAASQNLDSIKMELAENDLLNEDFPEVCHPIRALEGKPQRCQTQTHGGKQTHIGWTAEEVVLPTIAGSVASGAIIAAKGLTAVSRGMKYKRPDGTQQRPDFVFIDDPQTEESAASPLQTSKRLNILRKSVLKLGGHNKQLAAVIAATVIQPRDMIDQLLKDDPSWQGERIKMVRKWPDAHESHWLGKYAEIRRTYNRDDPEDQKRAHRDATAYYAENREAMDVGGDISWEHCYFDGVELSAIQHAYNILIDDGPDVFASECQNDPVELKLRDDRMVTAEDIASKLTGLGRGVVPLSCDRLTAFIDVQQDILFWMICAWGDGFSGSIIDYGAFPEQNRRHFTLTDVKHGLSAINPGAGVDGAILAGVRALTSHMLSRTFKREDGTDLRIGHAFVDSGFKTEVIQTACRQSEHAAVLMPSRGRGITASNKPMSEWPAKPGETMGLNYRIFSAKKSAGRFCMYDTNWWKTFVYERMATAMGDRGALSLFGRNPSEHGMLADHLTVEYRVRTEGRGRVVDEWKLPVHRPDNHWWDALVGCAVGASHIGVGLFKVEPSMKRRRVSFAEMQARARKKSA